ncbi:LPS biosynthesis-related glycosyltransferase [Chlorogloeopsis fritschii PCC 6912]|uniref:LPS biosynthesis-related glycosyltransferase n=1 Tax=Chlorogloeopsis fritschii PCC 6912 TaxID=211165 RepID=A0A3S0Y185_CHLFR|nr:glycosyltransferase family 9 protein [Chlorogloeopsis fritschii]RUR81789.1 LPS biosynthesis-related glycosyltransferase [Chlorogloeopsis fritschii PCC 6912]
MSHEHQLLKQLSISRIAIVRSLPGLGDLLCAVPAFRALRAAFPQAHITLIGLPWARSFVERFSHYLDDLLEFPGYPGIPEVPPSVGKLSKFLTSVHKQCFDLALQMHGNGTVINSFTALLGARIHAGFYLPGYYCPDPNYFLPYPDDQPEIWRHLRLMEFLGIPLQGNELEFPLKDEDFATIQQIPSQYVCIHPGASLPEKRWSLENFAVVGDAIAARGFQVVLTGSESEATLTQALAQMMHCEPINLAGKTSLGGMAALLSRASLLVCNDTGVSHLAAALKVGSVVIFTNSSQHRWAPLNCKIHRSLSPIFLANSYLAVTPEMVMAQVEDLLFKEVVIVT